MSIIIPGMKMPTNCDVCPFDNKLYCVAYVPSKDMIYDISDGRPDWCPLIELPPHGRLIDADAFLANLKKDPLFPLVEKYGMSGVIEAQPTIIPESGGNENE